MANRLENNHSDYHREDNEIMLAGPPLDLSFRNASIIEDLLCHTIETSRIGKLPHKSDNNRYLTSSMWLSNNWLASVTKLEELAKHYLESPIDLRWLDLSYNKLTDVDDDLMQFPNITILYLHGNQLADMKSIVKLRNLKSLRTLTLHGNPIERTPSYRRYVIAILPQISNLDFSPVIDTEKKRALPTGFNKTIQLDL